MKARNVLVKVSLLGALVGCGQDATDLAPHTQAQDEQTVHAASIQPIVGIWAASAWFTSVISASQNPTAQDWINRWSGGASGSSALTSLGFGSIGGEAASSPAISSWGEGRLDVFIRGNTGAVWHRSYQQGGSAWEELGGTTQGDPAAVSWGKGRIDLFVRGTDNALWQKTYDDGGWGTWTSIGGSVSSGPAVASSGEGSLDVVARGSNGGIMHRAFRDGRWGAWDRLEGNISSDPAIAIAEGRIHLVARGPDGTLWHRRRETGWSSWQSIAGTNLVQGSPALVASSNGRVDAYARGGDGALWTVTFTNNRWGSVRRIGGAIVESPDAVHSANGRIDVVVIGSDRAVYHRYYSFEESARSRDDDEPSWGED